MSMQRKEIKMSICTVPATGHYIHAYGLGDRFGN